MENVKLLPCPFCGGEATMTTGVFNKDIRCIMCRNCHIKTTIYDTNEEAIAAWNTRANTIQVGNGENYEVAHNETT